MAMIELAAVIVIILIVLRAVVRAAPWLLAVPVAMFLSTVAPLEAWQPWRDAFAAWVRVDMLLLMLPAWAFGTGLARTLWPLYVKAKRHAAHQGVDKAHDAML
jgi:hypothetical protein